MIQINSPFNAAEESNTDIFRVFRNFKPGLQVSMRQKMMQHKPCCIQNEKDKRTSPASGSQI